MGIHGRAGSPGVTTMVDDPIRERFRSAARLLDEVIRSIEAVRDTLDEYADELEIDDSDSVHCPECGEQGFDGRGIVHVEGTRMYLRGCWHCGTEFAVEDDSEVRP